MLMEVGIPGCFFKNEVYAIIMQILRTCVSYQELDIEELSSEFHVELYVRLVLKPEPDVNFHISLLYFLARLSIRNGSVKEALLK
jgi:hypothetical protein